MLVSKADRKLLRKVARRNSSRNHSTVVRVATTLNQPKKIIGGAQWN